MRLDVICGDVVEVSPPFDAATMTALAGAQKMVDVVFLVAEGRAARGAKPLEGVPHG
ncbi:MAG: hypothetical protein ACHRXM_19160 [Isosphaerales bacterium]